jgi:hypothetical protein
MQIFQIALLVAMLRPSAQRCFPKDGAVDEIQGARDIP